MRASRPIRRLSEHQRGRGVFTLVELPFDRLRAGPFDRLRVVSKREGVAFTLVELLVVVGILGLLVCLLLPSLARAKEQARSAVCKTNLKGLGTALCMYETQNGALVVPSYTMTGVMGGADVPLDGWGPILDRDRLAPANRQNTGSLFVCPSMADVDGMKDGQTGSDPQKPKGWMDWPNIRTGSSNIAVTIPQHGFNRMLRVAYWINADNPIGGLVEVINEVFYSSSVGYGPGSNGQFLRATRSWVFRHPTRLITLADGLYAGRQRDARLGTPNSRIGYRHPGRVATANLALADGHVEAVAGDRFPRAAAASNPPAEVYAENIGGPFTVYADPDKSLPPP
jgi:prepilin-type processing-associated H-X9-DG protein